MDLEQDLRIGVGGEEPAGHRCRRAGGRGPRARNAAIAQRRQQDSSPPRRAVQLLRELRQTRAHPTESLQRADHRRESTRLRRRSRSRTWRARDARPAPTAVCPRRSSTRRSPRRDGTSARRRIGQVLHAIVVGAQVGRVADLFAQREGRGRERANGAPRGCGRGQLELRSSPGARARRDPSTLACAASVAGFVATRSTAHHAPPMASTAMAATGMKMRFNRVASRRIRATSSARAECAASFG